MAVPFNCNQYVSPSMKILLFIIISIAVRKKSLGKCGSLDSLCCVSSALRARIPMSVFIFVYIDVASAVKSLDPVGRCRMLICCRSAVESLMYDGMRCRICFILKSNQVLNIDVKLLTQQTTGRNLSGVLWTFGIP